MSTLGDAIGQKADQIRAALEEKGGIEPDSWPEEIRALIAEDQKYLGALGNVPALEQTASPIVITFSPMLAEGLLRDASVLLDRCLQARKEYHELAAKWFEVRVQCEEFLLSNAITTDEEQRILPKQAQIALADADQARVESTADGANQQEAEGIVQTILNAKDALVRLTAAAATAQGYLTLPREERDNRFGAAEGFDEEFLRTHNRRSATANTEHNIDVESYGFKLQQSVFKGLYSVATAKAAGAEVNAALRKDQNDIILKRNDVARSLGVRRLHSLLDRGGELNYAEQLTPIKDRFRNDFDAAWARLSAASEGLSQLYDYPRPDFLLPGARSNALNFDEIVNWTQCVNVWLAAFQDTQQVVTWSLSIRKLLGSENFPRALTDGATAFSITEAEFPSGVLLVRMRGLTVQVKTSSPNGSWNIAIQPPPIGLLRRSDGSVRQLDQAHVGTLYLGMVRELLYAVMPEQSSPPKLQNCSPFGEWRVLIVGSRAEDVLSLEDIELHITAAVV